jgi:hypothetical protein
MGASSFLLLKRLFEKRESEGKALAHPFFAGVGHQVADTRPKKDFLAGQPPTQPPAERETLKPD